MNVKNSFSDINRNENKFIRFRTSNLKEDVGQTTIPFLDIQPVEPIPHVPISGTGLYHKATDSSGFLGIKLITEKIESYIDLNKIEKELGSINFNDLNSV